MRQRPSISSPPLLLENAVYLPGYERDPARACRPLGDFLLWAVERGLAPEHAPALERIRFAPGAYVVNVCDSRLTLRDFAPAAHPFLRRIFHEYRERCPMTPGLASYLDHQLHCAGLPMPEPARLPTRALPTQASLQARDAWSIGSFVTHFRFGVGRVLDIQGQGEEAKLRVSFEDGERTLLARFFSRTLPE
jgi:hypothetical protein